MAAAPEAVPKAAPEDVPKAAPEAVPEAAPEAAPKAVGWKGISPLKTKRLICYQGTPK